MLNHYAIMLPKPGSVTKDRELTAGKVRFICRDLKRGQPA